MKAYPYSGIRRSISQYVRLASRINPIALNADVRAHRLVRFCSDRGYTCSCVLIKAIAHVARQHPFINAILARDRLLRKRIFVPDAADVCIAMEKTHNGETFVVTPVVRDVQHKSFDSISAELAALGAAAYGEMPGSMEKQLFGLLPDSIKYLILKFICQQPGLFQRYFGTIGLSNIGKHGVQYFFPVWLNTVVFGAGSIAEKPVAVDGQVRAEPVLPLTLCFNHCVIDGVDAARALASMRRYIEQGEYESALSNDAGLN